MSIKRFCQMSVAAVALMLTMLMGACSSAPSAEDILETIPANSLTVIRFDIKSMLDNAGVKESGGKYDLSDDLDRLFDELPSGVREKAEDLLRVLPAVDAENVFFFFTEKEEFAFTAGLKHAGEVADALKKEFGSPEKDGEFSIYEVDRDVRVILRKNQMWITESNSRLTRALDRAADDNFTSFIGPAQHLLESRTLSVVLNLKSISKVSGADFPAQLEDYKKDFVTIDANLDGPALTVESSMMNADGKNKYPGDMFEEINTSFLRYIPGDATAVFAVGKPTEAFKDLVRSVVHHVDEAVERVLSVDGTSGFAMVMPETFNEILEQSNWNYIGFTHMPQAMVNELADGMFEQAPNVAHQYNYTNPWGYSMIGFGGPTVYWGNYDGYLMFSSQPITSNNNNSFTTALEGKCAAGCVLLPKSCPLMTEFEIPFGATATFALESDGAKGVLKLTGTDDGMLESLIRLAADKKWQRRITDKFFGYQERSYDNYDWDYDDYEAVEEVAVEDYDSIAY